MITQSTEGRVVRQRRLVLYKAFLRRDFAMAFSYRLPFVVDIFQSVLSVAFLYFLARVVGHKVLAESQLKVSYFGFAVIGTVMVAILTVNLTSFSKRVRADQLTGTLEVLFSMPVKPWLVILASASYQVIYAMISASLSIGLAFWLGLRFHVTGLSLLVGLGDFVSTMIIFAALGMALAAFVMVFKRGETLTTLLIGALEPHRWCPLPGLAALIAPAPDRRCAALHLGPRSHARFPAGGPSRLCPPARIVGVHHRALPARHLRLHARTGTGQAGRIGGSVLTDAPARLRVAWTGHLLGYTPRDCGGTLAVTRCLPATDHG